jgi:putative PIN family toxin of toxin-antitoxin system
VNPRTKIVVDSNVLVSAALGLRRHRFTSPSVVLWTKVATREVIAVASSQMLYELVATLEYPRLELPARFIIDYVERIADAVDMVSIRGLDMGCRDPRDNIFIETAYNGRVDALVTRDADLQDWKTRYTLKKRFCQVLNVSKFLQWNALNEKEKIRARPPLS